MIINLKSDIQPENKDPHFLTHETSVCFDSIVNTIERDEDFWVNDG